MPTARDLLQRFRPLGAPGAAAPAGVPADRVVERSRELQPVFDALAGTQEEAARIREGAAAQARDRRHRADARVTALLDAAGQEAGAARAEAAAAVVARGEEESRALLAAADADAAAIARGASERYEELVGRVVAVVRGRGEARVPHPAP